MGIRKLSLVRAATRAPVPGTAAAHHPMQKPGLHLFPPQQTQTRDDAGPWHKG